MSPKQTERAREILRPLLLSSPVPRDALPYTPDFEELKRAFERSAKLKLSDGNFWHLISNTAKKGGLAGRARRKKATPLPKQTEEDKLEILRLFPDGIGNRDALPYTLKFDEIHRRFNQLTGRRITKEEFWRRVSSVAKLSRKPRPVFEVAPLGGLDRELVSFLERNNPWWRAQPPIPAEYYRRWAYEEVASRLQLGLAKLVVIRGSRRVGKSVIQNQLVDGLLKLGNIDPTGKPVDPSRILAVQFDDAPTLGTLKNPIEAIVRWFEDNVLKKTLNAAAADGRPVYLLLDEVQNLKDWSVQLKTLADLSDARIVVTGSSALRIRAGEDNLAGRMTPIELGPLRLTEIAGIRRQRELPPYAPDARLEDWKKYDFWRGLLEHGKKYAKSREESFALLSRFGGYPLCHSGPEADTEVLRQQLVGEVITKTIDHDPGHKPNAAALDPSFLREIFKMACRYAGQAVLPKRFADEISVLTQSSVPHAKVLDGLRFLSDSLLLHQVPSLEVGAKKQGFPPKLCICDPFVRNGFLQETIPLNPAELINANEAVATQAGHLIESTLGYFLKGIPGLDLAHFPSRATEPEVDFVLTIGTSRIPVEVKYRSKGIAGENLAGLRHFIQKPSYSSDFGIVVTQSREGELEDKILAIPASTLLLLR